VIVMSVPTAGSAGQLAGRREWIGLAVLALPTLLVSIDMYVMLLALPKLSADLGASSVQQLWITDIYGFILAGLLVTMGTLGDRIGRRKLLLIGASVFGAASILSAYSTSPEMLIVARAMLGIAGATLAPGTMSLIGTLFRDPKQQSMAIGIWAMCFSVGAIIGPLVGGVMLDHFWWGSVFLLGVPAMLLLLVLGPIFLPEYKNPEGKRLDPISVGLSLLAILPFVFGLKSVVRNGWQVFPTVALVVGVVAGWVFIRRQRHLASPLLDLRLFANRAFSSALGSVWFGTMLMGVIMLFISQYLELVSGLSPLRSGLWMLPAVLANTVSFMVSPILGRYFRPAYLIAAGLAVSISGLVVMTTVDASTNPGRLIIGFALMFLGAGPLVTLGTNLVISSAPMEKMGSAAAINETSGQLGFALGIAILGSVGLAVYRSQLHLPAGVPSSVAQSARESLAGAVSSAGNHAVLDPARAAFTSGLNVVALISAVVLAGVAVLAAVLLRHVAPTGQVAPADATPAATTGALDADEDVVVEEVA
jgi:DHA2 family multidrug resistance protein-like MFS transporter